VAAARKLSSVSSGGFEHVLPQFADSLTERSWTNFRELRSTPSRRDENHLGRNQQARFPRREAPFYARML